MAVNSGEVTLELGVLARLAVDREHSIKNFPATVGGAFLGLAKGGTDEFRIGCVKVLAQRLDEMNQILLVPAGKRGTATVPIALPP